jgi:hypothetical protein
LQSVSNDKDFSRIPIAMPAGVLPTSDQIRSWNSDDLKAEFVNLQTDKSRRSLKEDGRLSVDELFGYLTSVLDRVEVLQNTPTFSPQQLDAIKLVFQMRLDAITSANCSPAQLAEKKRIFDRLKDEMPSPRRALEPELVDAARAFYNFFAASERSAPLHVEVIKQLRSASRALYTFFAAGKSGIVGSTLFCFNAGLVFLSAYGLFDAIDIAGPLMATCFYSLMIFAYIAMDSRMSELAVVFCLVAFAIAIATGLVQALMFVLTALVILACLSEGGIKSWLGKISRPRNTKFRFQ